MMRKTKVGEAAKILGVSSSCIRQWADKGLLKPINQGSHRVFDSNDVLELKNKLAAKKGEIEKPNDNDWSLVAKQYSSIKIEATKRLIESLNSLAGPFGIVVGEEIFFIPVRDITEKWVTVKYKGRLIFAASHYRGQEFHYKLFSPFGNEEEVSSLAFTKAIVESALGSIKRQRIVGTSKGSLEEVMLELCKHIGNYI